MVFGPGVVEAEGEARRWPARSGGYRAGQSRKYRRVSRRARHRHAGIHGDRREPGGRCDHGNPFQGRADRQEQRSAGGHRSAALRGRADSGAGSARARSGLAQECAYRSGALSERLPGTRRSATDARDSAGDCRSGRRHREARSGQPRGRSSERGLHPHPLADRRPRGSAQYRSRQRRRCERHIGTVRDHPVEADHGHLHHRRGCARPGDRRNEDRAAAQGAGARPGQRASARRRHAHHGGQPGEHHDRYGARPGDFSEYRQRAISESIRQCAAPGEDAQPGQRRPTGGDPAQQRRGLRLPGAGGRHGEVAEHQDPGH